MGMVMERAKEPSLVAVSPSASEIGRAELYGTTKTRTTQGAAQVGETLLAHNRRQDVKAAELGWDLAEQRLHGNCTSRL